MEEEKWYKRGSHFPQRVVVIRTDREGKTFDWSKKYSDQKLGQEYRDILIEDNGSGMVIKRLLNIIGQEKFIEKFGPLLRRYEGNGFYDPAELKCFLHPKDLLKHWAKYSENHTIGAIEDILESFGSSDRTFNWNETLRYFRQSVRSDFDEF